MYHNNPYAQAGWYNPENPMSINSREASTSYVPSVFGALPVVGAGSEERLLTFNLVPNKPDILNCSICGPTGTPYIEIQSDYTSLPSTFFRKPDGAVLAYIDWANARSMVSISGIVTKQPVGQWLSLSADRRSRTMVAKGRPFIWVPKDNQIALFAGVMNSEPLATISRNRNLVTLKLSTEAVTAGLLESCIVATVLLQCGRNID